MLAAIVGEDRVRSGDYERAYHARGRSYLDLLRLRAGDLSEAPDAVVYPRGTEEVLAVLALASEREIAVVPFGGGTGATGGVTAQRGRFGAVITLDMSDMDRLIAVDPVSQTAVAQAGISGPALEKALEAKGLTLEPQSCEFSTLGGSIAQGDAGDWLIGAKLATPRGLIEAGPRWKGLLLGSQGVLGVITEASIRVRQLPEVSDHRAYLFRDFASGAAAVREAMQAGVQAAMLRVSDAETTRFLSAFRQVGKSKTLTMRLIQHTLDWRGYGERPCNLIAGFEGKTKTVSFARAAFDAIAKKHGALVRGRVGGDQWKKTRFATPYLRDSLLDRGVGVETIETAAPWSRLDALYAAVRTAIESAIAQHVPRQGAKGVVMGELDPAYTDGARLRFTVIFPRLLDGDVAQAQAISQAAHEAILANGGTHQDVHPLGVAAGTSELAVAALRAVKAALDPKGVLNPGTLLSD
jgi:alkyldihydroxyacetonephosphate synthase